MGGTSAVKVVGVSVLDQLKVLHAATDLFSRRLRLHGHDGARDRQGPSHGQAHPLKQLFEPGIFLQPGGALVSGNMPVPVGVTFLSR
jgi:hypothetical protein